MSKLIDRKNMIFSIELISRMNAFLHEILIFLRTLTFQLNASKNFQHFKFIQSLLFYPGLKNKRLLNFPGKHDFVNFSALAE